MVSLTKILLGITHVGMIITENCTKVVTRKEIRDLTLEERTSYLKAANKLHTKNPDITKQFTKWHMDSVKIAHKLPVFLPWHRMFIRLYEQELQKINSNVTLPYWDWSRDSKNPEKSSVFSKELFGGNGQSSDHCVTNGIFANMKLDLPEPHCLRRDFSFDAFNSSYYDPKILEVYLSKTDSYDDFRKLIEIGPHDTVHDSIGGKVGDMGFMQSPNDPIFFLHHAFVDLLWNEWQLRSPELAKTYNGGSVHPDDTMTPFNVDVKSTFNTTVFCYNYPRFDSNRVSFSKYTSKLAKSSGALNAPPKVNNAAQAFQKIDALIEDLNNQSMTQSSPMEDKEGSSQLSRNIPTPRPLSEDYIRRHGFNLTEIREIEQRNIRLVDALNRAS